MESLSVCLLEDSVCIVLVHSQTPTGASVYSLKPKGFHSGIFFQSCAVKSLHTIELEIFMDINSQWESYCENIYCNIIIATLCV